MNLFSCSPFRVLMLHLSLIYRLSYMKIWGSAPEHQQLPLSEILTIKIDMNSPIPKCIFFNRTTLHDNRQILNSACSLTVITFLLLNVHTLIFHKLNSDENISFNCFLCPFGTSMERFPQQSIQFLTLWNKALFFLLHCS